MLPAVRASRAKARRLIPSSPLILTLMVVLAVAGWPGMMARRPSGPVMLTLAAPARVTQMLVVTAPASADIAASARRRLHEMRQQGYASVSMTANVRALRPGVIRTRIVWRGSASQVSQITSGFRAELVMLGGERTPAAYAVGPIVTTGH